MSERRKELIITSEGLGRFANIVIGVSIIIGGFSAFFDLQKADDALKLSLESMIKQQNIINEHFIAQLAEMKGDIKTLENP